eukprot:scaffold15878_cov51-Cylindrotheca_fusiformis.AAC.1
MNTRTYCVAHCQRKLCLNNIFVLHNKAGNHDLGRILAGLPVSNPLFAMLVKTTIRQLEDAANDVGANS